ncbi:hypothetical protein [Methanobrevibacter sp.]
MEIYKFCIFLLLLVLLSLGFVSASGESDVFEPLNDSFVDKIGVKVSLETTEWSLGKIIINDLHEKPIKEQLKDFIKEDFVLSILQLFFSGGYDYLFRGEVNL